MAIPMVGPVAPVGAGSAAEQMAQLYRQRMLTEMTALDSASPVASSGALEPGAAGRGAEFDGIVGRALQEVDSLDRTAATKAVQAATGDLTDVHDYVIAATQAQTATELATTVRNKALDAFNDIMRMPL
ncbi:MAG TPA: flagellar hook-basal body complex protein FliE [Kineosporiaceae bacterium]